MNKANVFLGILFNVISSAFLCAILSPNSRNKMTEGIGVTIDIDTVLKAVMEQPPAIHDLKFKFDSGNLYEFLKNAKIGKMQPNNRGISLEPLKWENITAKITVYPKTVHIDLACTFQPYRYSPSGAIEFRKCLEEIRDYMVFLSQDRAKLLPVDKWIITQYHFGRDGKESLSGYSFEHTWKDLEGGIMRIYTKQMLDDRITPRIEQICTPKRTVGEEISIMMRLEDLSPKVTMKENFGPVNRGRPPKDGQKKIMAMVESDSDKPISYEISQRKQGLTVKP